ncbi:MAG: PepSY domain-containing protein [Planctomycetes bacterium]|nr:PepSY domain-containing protein [Planctomycetota bacterium]
MATISRLAACTVLLAGLAAAVPACSKAGDDSTKALAASKTEVAKAIKAAKQHVGEGFATEVELEMDADKPVYQVEFVCGGKLKGVTVDAVEGAILGAKEFEPSEKEKAIIAALEAVPEEARLGLAKAVKEAVDQAKGASPVEVDLRLEAERLFYDVRLLLNGESRSVQIDLKKP